MPLANRTLTAAGKNYGRPFEGPLDHRAQGIIDVTALDNTVVDANGYLKPGVILRQASAGVFTLITGAGQAAFGAAPEAIKVANGNAAGDFSAASATFPIAIVTICQLRRGIVEDNLGRVLNANELASVIAAASNVVLLG